MKNLVSIAPYVLSSQDLENIRNDMITVVRMREEIAYGDLMGILSSDPYNHPWSGLNRVIIAEIKSDQPVIKFDPNKGFIIA